MKGQVYILISVLVLIILILLKASIQPFQEKEDFLFENFLDLKNEIIKIVDISLLNKQDVSENLNEFEKFSKDFYNRKNYIEDFNYTVLKFDNTTTVKIDLYLGFENSYLKDSFIIKRTVYE